MLRYRFTFSTMDSGVCDGLGDPCDMAGTLEGGAFSPLTTSSGIAVFSLQPGETFGFQVATLDNQGEPGILKLSDPGQAAPEPGSFGLALTALGALAVLRVMHPRHRTRPTPQAMAAVIGAVLFSVGAGDLVAQNQFYPTSSVTGQLKRTTVTNAARLATQRAFAISRLQAAGPETKPNWIRPPHPPTAQRFSALVSPQATTIQTPAGYVGNRRLRIRPFDTLDQRLANNGNQFSVEPPESEHRRREWLRTRRREQCYSGLHGVRRSGPCHFLLSRPISYSA